MLCKPVFSYGAAALAAGALLLAAPRVAHAVAATLVQVTNTTANPAITQGTEKQAAQVLELYCFAYVGGDAGVCVESVPTGGVVTYTPGADSYIITAVDLLPQSSGAVACGSLSTVSNVSLSANGNLRYQWDISGPLGSHFAYPSGIVTQPGATFTMTVANSGGCGIVAYLHGYLTAN